MDRVDRVDQVFGFLLSCGGIPGGIDEEVINGNDAAVGQNLGGVEDILDPHMFVHGIQGGLAEAVGGQRKAFTTGLGIESDIFLG